MASHKVTGAKRKIKVMSEDILREVMGANELPIRMGRAKSHHKSDSQAQAQAHNSECDLLRHNL